MVEKLTELGVTKKRPEGIVWDQLCTGLGLKTTGRGKKKWLLQTVYPGATSQAKRTIGEYPGMSLAEARATAERWRGQVKQGVDPAEHAVVERRKADEARRLEALKNESTFAACAARFCSGRTNRRRAKDRLEIDRMLVAAWGDRPIHQIAPRDVRELFDRLKRHAPYDARNAWGHAVGIFKMACHEELIPVSPIASLDKKLVFKGAKLAHRQRVLNDDELRAFWKGTFHLDQPLGPFYRLLALTAVRKSELTHARWAEVHGELRRLIRDAQRTGETISWAAVPPETKTWVVPPERFKSGVAHIVPLTDDACEILASLYADKRTFIFPAPTSSVGAPIYLADRHKRRLDAAMLVTLQEMARQRGDDPHTVKLAAWKTHDLRRVVRTNLSGLDVPDHISEMVLGHARQGLQRIYDQHRYERQVREALERWAERLRSLVAPTPASPPTANIVPLNRAKGRRR